MATTSRSSVTRTCYCSKFCGIRGKEVPSSTYQRHNPDESGPKRFRKRRRVDNPTDEQEQDIPGSNLLPGLQHIPVHPPHEEPSFSPDPRNDNDDLGPSLQNELDDMMQLDLQMAHEQRADEGTPPPSPARNSEPELPIPRIEDIRIANEFIKLLRSASLDDKSQGLDEDTIHNIRNPRAEPLVLDPDQRLSIDLFLSLSNTSVETYNTARAAILRRHPDDPVLTYHSVKKLISQLSGIVTVTHDMCINSCMAYVGPFAELETCRECGEPRYDPKRSAKVPRQRFDTILIGPQLQALRCSKEAAEEMRYRREVTKKILADLDANDGVKTRPYGDFFDGSDYIDAVRAGKIKDEDTVLMASVDGAQLYRNKPSDCWILVWLIMDRSLSTRFKKLGILPGVTIPGPNKPKHIDSFFYPSLYHLAAIQREGLKVYDAIEKQTLDTHPFLALGTADGPGMAALNGCVGHHGKCACRIYCPIKGRHKPGCPHYYPVRFKPDNYSVAGCDHEDVHLGPLLDGFNSETAAQRFKENTAYVAASQNRAQYEKRRLETGICKPTIFSGLPPDHILGVPDLFGLDYMHLPNLNLPDLFLSLWRGTIDIEKTDNKATWDWVVLIGDVWKKYGKSVADLHQYFPASFDRAPRNPAEKLSSGYKAWEHLLHLFGVGPALLYGILPEKYYRNYCKVVRAVRLLTQEEITPEELLEAHQLMSEFSDEFEHLYVQRREDRIHFVRLVLHTLSHMAGETTRKGPGNIYSQWAMERTIGNLGEEIKQHSNAYANLSQRAIRRSELNALKAMIPDLEPEHVDIPAGAVDLGDGYLLLRATDSCRRDVRASEAEAIRDYIRDEFGDEEADDWRPSVVRWARVRLPNGQIIRSLWKEAIMTQLRSGRHVKVQIKGDDPEFVEILFFMRLHIDEEEREVAVASFFGPPDPHLLQISSKTYWSMQHLREQDVRVIEIKDIVAGVMMAPDLQYSQYRSDGSEVDRWFLVEKPGIKLSWCDKGDDMEEDD